jgi:hypothetical protein
MTKAKDCASGCLGKIIAIATHRADRVRTERLANIDAWADARRDARAALPFAEAIAAMNEETTGRSTHPRTCNPRSTS